MTTRRQQAFQVGREAGNFSGKAQIADIAGRDFVLRREALRDLLP